MLTRIPTSVLKLSALTPPLSILQHEGPMMRLEKFDGRPDACGGFMLKCTLCMTQNPANYQSSTRPKCPLLFLISLERLQSRGIPYGKMVALFKTGFKHPADGLEIKVQLLKLSFRSVAARSSLQSTDETDIQSELGCWDDKLTLDRLIALAIRLDNLTRTRGLPMTQTKTRCPRSLWT